MMKKLSKLGRANLILLLVLTLMLVSAVVSAQEVQELQFAPCLIAPCASADDCPQEAKWSCGCFFFPELESMRCAILN